MKMKNKKYYAYFVPRTKEQGITEDWEECRKIVSGETEAKFKSFPKLKDAEEWLSSGADYAFRKDLEPGIYFDAGTGRGDGTEISVTDEKGKDLLKEVLTKDKINKYGKHLLPQGTTNNYGELLACKFALELAVKKEVKRIFGDSKLVINYWSKAYVKEEEVNMETLDLIDEVKLLRDKFENQGGALIYIEGRDNPADLGFHK